jgi:hypothetical protein
MRIKAPGIKHRWRNAAYTLKEMKARVHIDPVAGCWNWLLSLNMHGYGQASHKGQRWSSHRLMFQLMHPRMSLVGKTICHHCDNRACINPEHLYAGTPMTNMHDMISRGRAVYPGGPRGEAHKNAKLNSDKIREIRARHASGEGYRKLGKAFGVDRTTIKRIIQGRQWRHVK